MTEVEGAAGGGAETVPCPSCGAAVSVAEAAGEGEATCPRCGNRVPVGKEPTGGVRPS